MSYLLGDNETAARRLEALARVFEPATRDFLRSARRFLPESMNGTATAAQGEAAATGLVLDLGCGPGHTTRLLAETLGSASTVGIDSSTKFIGMAAKPAPADATVAGASFLVHDVTSVPFPIGPADLIYSRFLLMHLEDPVGAMKGWASQLGSGGVQVMEELEEIQTGNHLFRQYLNLVVAALADQGKEMFIGASIGGMSPAAGTEIIINQIADVTVPAADAATLFFLNIQTLRRRPFVAANYSATVLDDLSAGLEELAGGGRAAAESPPVSWSLRQMVFRRAG